MKSMMQKLTVLVAVAVNVAAAQTTVRPLAVSDTANTVQAQTPASVTAYLIQSLRDSYRNWQSQGATYTQDLSQPYFLNGKEISRKSRENALHDFRPQKTDFDEFEASFTGVFPSTAVLTYRLTSEMQTGRGKTKVFSVYVKQTYEYVNSQWVTRKMEAVTAR